MVAQDDWVEVGQHLWSESRQRWMAHCCSCGTGVEELRYEPPVDYLCEDCEETAE